MAAQGLRDMGDGPEKIANPIEAALLRARGNQVLLASLGTAAAATTLVVLAAAI